MMGDRKHEVHLFSTRPPTFEPGESNDTAKGIIKGLCLPPSHTQPITRLIEDCPVGIIRRESILPQSIESWAQSYQQGPLFVNKNCRSEGGREGFGGDPSWGFCQADDHGFFLGWEEEESWSELDARPMDAKLNDLMKLVQMIVCQESQGAFIEEREDWDSSADWANVMVSTFQFWCWGDWATKSWRS